MNPHDNLDLASFLDTQPAGAPPEAATRAAWGRAYYAAFGVARDAVISVRGPLVSTGKGDEHKEVSGVIKRSRHKSVRKLGGLLEQLRSRRNSADYDVGLVALRGAPFVPPDSTTAIRLASRVIAGIATTRARDATFGL